MNVEIIPAINATTFEEVKRKVKLVEPYVSWVHLDVADGSFSDVTLWHNPDDVLELQTPLFIEVHLMLDRIDERVDEWLKSNVRRLIFHYEASRDPDTVIEVCHQADIQSGIAIRPDTPAQTVFPYLARVDLVQALAVVPGPAGQKFRSETLSKVSALRHACHACHVEVDGGIDMNTAPQVVHAGADTLVAASAIFNAPDIRKAIQELRSHANV